METLQIILTGVFVIFFYGIFKVLSQTLQYLRKKAVLNRLPHDPMHWFWGHWLQFPSVPDDRGLKWRREMTERYPDGYLIWFGPTFPAVNLTSPISTKSILKTTEPKGYLYNFLRPWLGDGLLLSHGKKWSRNRRLLTPAFHFEILKTYLHIKNKAANEFCSKITDLANNQDYFDICKPVTMFTLDVILKCAFSYETNCQTLGESHPYVLAVNEMSRILIRRFMKPWLHPDLIFFLTSDGRKMKKYCDYVHNITEKIILEKQKNLTTNSPNYKGYKDFLDILLLAKDEDGTGLTNKEIRDEVDTFLFEGHDTTASGIYWTLYSIAQHSSIQEKLRTEINSLMATRHSDDLLSSDLNKLPYLTMCIKESLRLHNVISFIVRHIQHDYKIGNHFLPKDTATSILIYNVHHNPQYWQNSLQFNPDRFSPENIEKINPFAYIPFSAGPRNCIGQNFAMHEMKTLLVKVLYRFHLAVDPDHVIEKIESIVMRAKYGIKLKFTPIVPSL